MSEKIMSAMETAKEVVEMVFRANGTVRKDAEIVISDALITQAKLYEGQIESLEEALIWSDTALREMHRLTNHNAIDKIPVHVKTSKALANLAEFRKQQNKQGESK